MLLLVLPFSLPSLCILFQLIYIRLVLVSKLFCDSDLLTEELLQMTSSGHIPEDLAIALSKLIDIEMVVSSLRRYFRSG